MLHRVEASIRDLANELGVTVEPGVTITPSQRDAITTALADRIVAAACGRPIRMWFSPENFRPHPVHSTLFCPGVLPPTSVRVGTLPNMVISVLVSRQR